MGPLKQTVTTVKADEDDGTAGQDHSSYTGSRHGKKKLDTKTHF